MIEEQRYILKRKLPDLLYALIEDKQTQRILDSLECSPSTLLGYLSAQWFPSDEKLKQFCNEFCFKYSTLKTWRVK